MDQPPAVAPTASADAWPRAMETEIGAALCAIRRGKDFDFFLTIPMKILFCVRLRGSKNSPSISMWLLFPHGLGETISRYRNIKGAEKGCPPA